MSDCFYITAPRHRRKSDPDFIVARLSDGQRVEAASEVPAMMNAGMTAAALELAEHGFNLTPVKANSNKPPLLKDYAARATSDPAVIETWQFLYPRGFNLGIVTGARSGAWVLDIDSANHGVDGEATLARLEADNGPLPATVEARSPGGGRHLYFRYPDNRRIGSSAGRLGEGLDVRGEGAYITAEPSFRPDGRYTWTNSPCRYRVSHAPDWVLDLVDPPKPRFQSRPVAKLSGRGRRGAEDRLREAGLQVVAARPGTRNDTLNAQMFRMMGDVDRGLIAVDEVATELACAAFAAGLPMPEVKATLASAMRGRVRNG